jgi:hypothetical protein
MSYKAQVCTRVVSAETAAGAHVCLFCLQCYSAAAHVHACKCAKNCQVAFAKLAYTNLLHAIPAASNYLLLPQQLLSLVGANRAALCCIATSCPPDIAGRAQIENVCMTGYSYCGELLVLVVIYRTRKRSCSPDIAGRAQRWRTPAASIARATNTSSSRAHHTL